MYLPLNYEQLNVVDGTYNPSMVKSYNNKTFMFWERSLFQRAASTIEWGLPDAWTGAVHDFFVYCMFRFGYVAVWESEELGSVFNPATLSGYDFYYRPTKALIANPTLENDLDLTIGKDCEILKLTPDYRGIWDVISYYAEKLSTLDNAINMSLINNKFAFILGARNKVAGDALKKMLDKINKGEPAVIYDIKLLNDRTDKTEPFQVWERSGSLKDSYLTTEQLADFQTLINNFDAEIGIPSVPYQKKERLVTDEANMRSKDSAARSIVWLETIEQTASKIRELYPDINITAKLRYKEENENGQLTDDPDRDV